MTDERWAGRLRDALDAITGGSVVDGLGAYAVAVSDALDADSLDRGEQRVARHDATDAVDRAIWSRDAAETDWGRLNAAIDAHAGDWLADEVLAAATARNVVRAEHTDADWATVPESVFAFLGDIQPAGEGGSTPAWQYSFSYYAWAFKHPSVDVESHILARAGADPVWAPSAAACAAHLDFDAALDATAEIARQSDSPASAISYIVTIREDTFPGEARIDGWSWVDRYGYGFRWSEARARAVAEAVVAVVGVDVPDHTSIQAVRDAIDEPMQDEPL